MVLCKRLIARLDIKGGRLIKGVRLEGLKVVGDPAEAARRYADEGADELIYLDAVASLYGRNSLDELLRRASADVFIPITAGGGVRSVADAARLLAAGADKVAVNTAALKRPQLITELAQAFGSQCVVASIQARRRQDCRWEAMAEAGRERTGQDVMDWIQQLEQLGAGEILLTSVDQDGTCAGPDQQLMLCAAALSKLPIVVSGGFADMEQVADALHHPGLSAVCIGAALHNRTLELIRLKHYLVGHSNLPMRLASLSKVDGNRDLCDSLAGINIGIVDYGMGNQQSLVNALRFLGANTCLSSEAAELEGSDLIALPGVGSFREGMVQLRARSLDSWLCSWAAEGKPLLGICLGMQLLFKSGDEHGPTTGLGILDGTVTRLKLEQSQCSERLPHIGWNSLVPGPACWGKREKTELLQYFVHSYVAKGVSPEIISFNCRFGSSEIFPAVVKSESVIGFQCHPERGGGDGLLLLSYACRTLAGTPGFDIML